MDIAYMASTLTRAGVVPQALQDGMRRAAAAFSGSEHTETEMDAWVSNLIKDASHLFGRRSQAAPDDDEDLASTPAEALGWPEEVYAKASPETKLAAWRELQAETGEVST